MELGLEGEGARGRKPLPYLVMDFIELYSLCLTLGGLPYKVSHRTYERQLSYTVSLYLYTVLDVVSRCEPCDKEAISYTNTTMNLT